MTATNKCYNFVGFRCRVPLISMLCSSYMPHVLDLWVATITSCDNSSDSIYGLGVCCAKYGMIDSEKKLLILIVKWTALVAENGSVQAVVWLSVMLVYRSH